MQSKSASLFERHNPEIIESTIAQIIHLKNKENTGMNESTIMQEVFTDGIDEDAYLVFEMALARLNDAKTPRIMLPLFMTRSDLRFATQRDIANHRAKRLACDTIMDAGCGIGSQTIAFARTCKKVIAVDNDLRKAAFCKANCQKLGLSNVEVICEDALDALEAISDIDVVFCDPERAPESEKRSLDSMSPSILELVEALGHTTNECAVELPPRIKDVPLQGEMEYASINGKLSRLTLYRGNLAMCKTSAVCMPSGNSLPSSIVLRDSEPEIQRPHPETKDPLQWLFEIDEAVAAGGLVNVIKGSFSILKDSKPLLATSSQELSSPFFSARYRVIESASSKEMIKPLLEKCGAKKAVIRYPINPQVYWKERTQFEQGLTGNRTLHIFLLNERFILSEKVKKVKA